jgi:hypothetical protein
MSHEIVSQPVVRSPSDARLRRGRGFTNGEIAGAGISTREARKMGLILDNRRRTVHAENIEILKQYLEDLDAVALSVTETKAVKPARSDSERELSSLSGMKPDEIESLVSVGIKSLSDLAYCDIAKISKKSGLDEDRVTALVKAALKKV